MDREYLHIHTYKGFEGSTNECWPHTGKRRSPHSTREATGEAKNLKYGGVESTINVFRSNSARWVPLGPPAIAP